MNIVEYSNGNVLIIKKISKEKTKILRDIFTTSLLLEKTIVSPYYRMKLNEKEFLGLYNEYSSKLKVGPEVLLNFNIYQMNINRVIQNYLFSYRYFVDSTLERVKSFCGTNSDTFNVFDTMIHNAYDNSFAYRFFYKYRNYCTHFRDPIEEISLDLEELQQKVFKLKLILHKDQLLKYEKWNAIKNEIKDLPEKIDIMLLFSELINELGKIYHAVINTLYTSNYGYIQMMIKEYEDAIKNNNPERIAILFKNGKSGKIQYFPITFIKEIQNIRKSHITMI